MSNNSQNLYYPQGNANFGIYGAPRRNSKNTPKYTNHAKLIQAHIDELTVNTTMYEELTHYQEIEKIAKDRQLILTEIQPYKGGSKRKTRRNKH